MNDVLLQQMCNSYERMNVSSLRFGSTRVHTVCRIDWRHESKETCLVVADVQMHSRRTQAVCKTCVPQKYALDSFSMPEPLFSGVCLWNTPLTKRTWSESGMGSDGCGFHSAETPFACLCTAHMLCVLLNELGPPLSLLERAFGGQMLYSFSIDFAESLPPPSAARPANRHTR